MILIPLVIADSEQDMPGIEPQPLGWYSVLLVYQWYTSAPSHGLQEVRQLEVVIWL